MNSSEGESSDFYAVLGVKNRECGTAELKNAYKKLAMRWHPDRCSASGNCVEEAKKKFQMIQQAYSVLSDENKRFLYDLGVYDCDDDADESGMGDFLNEMAAMMSQTKANENQEETFEELQEMFQDLFQSDMESFTASSSTSSSSSRSTTPSCSDSSCNNIIRQESVTSPMGQFGGFCIGTGGRAETSSGNGGGNSSRRNGRKQKVSFGHDVLSSSSSRQY